MSSKYPFKPDYSVPPGATLREALEEKGISQADLAVRTGMAEKTISQIINGVASITYETAEKLEFALGIPARFWNKRELAYREAIARAEASKRLSESTGWLEQVPVKVLKERGLVPSDAEGVDLVRLVLKFFGVSSVEAWRAAWEQPAAQYRGKAVQEKKPGHVAAWLRMGDLQAEGISTSPFDAVEFKRALADIRKLTLRPASEWKSSMTELCAAAGVAFVITKEIAGAAISGATRWQTKDKAIIQLSLKYKTDDQFWFTFFHEAGHVLLHGKKQVFVDFGLTGDSDDEVEANAFAADFLIPPDAARQLPKLRTRAHIRDFAQTIGIAPGIVVGRMQFENYAWTSAFYDLKKKLTWAK